MIDARDLALQASCPLWPAPRFGSLPAMVNGQRLILAANGLFVQVQLDWLDCVQRIAPAVRLPLPYGRMDERLRFAFGRLPIQLIEAFIDAGRQGLPNEVAGVLVYRRSTRQLRLALCAPIDAAPGRIVYRRPAMAADETVAVDLHTHGIGRPFWSADDDRDDQGICIAGVFGCLHLPRAQAAFRLVLNGHYTALPHPWQCMGGASPPAHTVDHTARAGLVQRLLQRLHLERLPWNT